MGKPKGTKGFGKGEKSSSRSKLKAKQSEAEVPRGSSRLERLRETKPEEPSSTIKLSHIPYGFFELELLHYFRQFGDVRKVRVARNKTTGNHKGWAFVQFRLAAVAEVAAETMHGYLMFEKKLLCRVLKNREVPRCLDEGKTLAARPAKYATSRRHARVAAAWKSGRQECRAENRLLKSLAKKKKSLEELGLTYDFDVGGVTSEKIKTEIKKEEEDADEDVTYDLPASAGEENSFDASVLPEPPKVEDAPNDEVQERLRGRKKKGSRAK